MKTLPEFLEYSANLFPDKEALVFENTRLTYREWNERAEKISQIVQYYCQKQEIVSIVLNNSANFLIAYFAVLKAGCIAHIIPTNISDTNFELQLKEVDPTLIVTVATFLPLLQKLSHSKMINLDEDLPEAKNKEKRTVLPDDVSTIIYSSGTTSRPKGVKLQHKNVVAATENMIQVLGVTENDTYFNILPLTHSFGIGNVHMVVRQGGRVVIERNSINIPSWLGKINSEKATLFAAVPATLKMLTENFKEQFQTCKNLKLIVTNSTPIAPEITKKVLETLPGTQFYTYYGLTEASRSTFNHFNTCPIEKLHSVGKVAPNTAVKIINENGKECWFNEEGEVCVQGKHVISEYWQNEEASKFIKNNLIYTGDFGYLDEEGYLFLVGRKDEMINVGGEKVSPLEIESILKTIPGVLEVIAVGVKDTILNEVVSIVYAGNVTKEYFLQEARKKLKGYQVPKYIFEIIDLPARSIPQTDSGKIKRTLLKKMMEERIDGK